MKSKILLCLVFLFVFNHSFCTTYTAIANGNLESASTWSPSGPPSTGDIVIIPSGITVTVTTNYAPLLGNITISGTLQFANGSKLNLQAPAVVQITATGNITGGNPGSQIVYPTTSYAGPFSQTGPYYYTATGPSNGTLPLVFSNLSATSKSNSIEIRWNCYTDYAITTYQVERATDGRNFVAVGNVAPNGNALQTNYQWSDAHYSNGVNYYRIRSIDVNNKSYFSNIVMIKTNAAGKELTIYPNPVKGGQFSLQLNQYESGTYQIELYSVTGSLVLQNNFSISSAVSTNTFTLPSVVTNGIYEIKLKKNGALIASQKLVVAK